MYAYILEQWKVAAVTTEWVNACVVKKYITQEQCDVILATPQTPGIFGV